MAVFAACVILCFAFFLGFICGEERMQGGFQRECIKRGLAEYNTETGSWQWKDDYKKNKETK